MRYAIQRALAVTCRQIAVTGQAHGGRIERINRNLATVCFIDCSIDIERVTGRCGIKAARSIEAIRNQQHGIVSFPALVELLQRFNYLNVRVVG